MAAKSVSLVGVNLRPMPRPRVNRRGGAGFPASYRMHLKSLREQLKELEIAEGVGVAVTVLVWKPISPLARGFGDADNLAKTILEALPFDDSKVVQLHVAKLFGVVPAVGVRVEVVMEGKKR